MNNGCVDLLARDVLGVDGEALLDHLDLLQHLVSLVFLLFSISGLGV